MAKDLYYDRYMAPLNNLDLPIKIYGSSSNGNSVLVKPFRALIDLGFPYKTYSETTLADLDYILLTHEHSDHLNIATIRRIDKLFPRINFVMSNRLFNIIAKRNADVAQLISERIITFDFQQTLSLQTRDKYDLIVTPYSTSHGDDVINVAYDIKEPFDGTHLLYATDLDSLGTGVYQNVHGLPEDAMYNIMLLEANYNEDELHNAINQAIANGNSPVKEMGNLRHLSEEDAIHYASSHLTNNGIFVPLHGSSTFGTYLQTGGHI